MTGTKIIITTCHNTTKATALMAWVDECGDTLEAVNKLDDVNFAVKTFKAEIERIARRIILATIASKEFEIAVAKMRAFDSEKKHPKFQPNIKGFRK